MAAMFVWIKFQALAARLGVRVDQFWEMDAAEVQARLQRRIES